MANPTPKEANELALIYEELLPYCYPYRICPHQSKKGFLKEMRKFHCKYSETIPYFWHLKAKINDLINFTYILQQENIDMKQQIEELNDEIRSLEDADPFEGYEPPHNEGHD